MDPANLRTAQYTKDEHSRPPRLLQFICKLESAAAKGGKRYLFEDAKDGSMVRLSPVEVKRLEEVIPDGEAQAQQGDGKAGRCAA